MVADVVRRGAALMVATALVVSAAANVSIQSPASAATRLEGVCAAQPLLFAAKADDAKRADALLAGTLYISTFPPQKLPADIDWRKPPLTTTNFQAQFQSLSWTEPLRREYLRTGDTRYLDRYRVILQDFATSNTDHTKPLTPWTWYDFSEGRRASILGCAAQQLGTPAWLTTSLREHIESISTPSHYSGIGNHSLMQNAGIITAGVVVDDAAATSLGRRRAQAMLSDVVSTDGVSLEGSVHYHGLNDIWWNEFRDLVAAAGLQPLDTTDRIDLMDRFGSELTFPDGTEVNFGDGFPETQSRYAPATTDLATFRPGYLVSRSASNVGPAMLAVHYGQPFEGMPHGHMDAGTLELYAAGRRMISDSGPYAYGSGWWRNWAKGPSAHNVVNSPGTAYLKSGVGRLVAYQRDQYWLRATWVLPVMSKVTWYRTITQSLRHGWVVVMDEVVAPTSRQWVSRWNLPDGATYRVKPSRIDQASGAGGRMSLLQVAGTPTLRLVQGKRTSSLSTTAGWRSYSYEQIEPAPTAELWKTARTWRNVVVLVPRAAGEPADSVTVTGVRATATRVTFTVTTARGRTTLTMARLARP